MANVRYKDHTLLTGGIAAGDVFPMDELISGSTYQTRRATGAMLQAWALAGVGAAAISNDYNDLDNLPTLFDGAFASLSGKPTTLSGYGITDGVPTTRTVNGHALSGDVIVTASDLGLVIGADVQAFDADLTAIAALTPSNDDIIQRKGGVWVNRTIAQVKTDFGLAAIATSGSASDLTAGTIPDARFPATLPAASGVNLTALNASNLASGTVADARLSANVVLADGSRSFTAVVAGVSPVGASDLATKGYVDGLLVGLLDDRGNYDASVNTFPASGGSGTAGAVLKGDLWTISVAGTLGGHPVTAGDVVRALVDTPGQTDGNWAISENNLGYTPLNAALNDGQIYIGNGSNIGTARTLSGDVTVSNLGVTAIGATKVLSAMLNADVYSTAHSWAGQQTFVAPILGTPASGTLTNCTGLPPTTGISGWPANAAGALTNNGSGTLSWAAAGSGITVGTTAITSGTNTKVLFNNSGVVGEYAVTGTGNAVLSASPTLTGTVAAAAATFSDVVSLISTTAANNKITQGAAINIGTTSTDGVILQNTTAASVGAQQYSPRLRLTGSGWKTTATAAAQTVDWIIENQPVQGAANPSSNLILASQINGGGYSNTLTVGQGTLGITNGVQGTSTLSVSSGSLTVSAGLVAVGNITWGNGWGQLAGGAGSTAIITTAGTIDIRINPTSRNLIIGAADAANPGAQTLSVQSVVAGTSNTAGATWSLQASLGTSQGAPGRLHFKGGALIAASGSTQQTAIDREILAATKVLTNNTVTTVCNVTNASNTVASGFVDYTVEVFDGTDLQIETGYFFYQVTNKGGTIANNTITFPSATGVGVTPTNPKNTTTSGTLAVTWAISAANPALLSVNANSSLTPSTGYPRVTFNLRNTTQQAVAIQ